MLSKQPKDFTTGPLFWRITVFALPLMLTSLLQILYNMADNIVVGQFSGDPTALAAVGSTLTAAGIIVNFLIGISTGAGIVVARSIGASDDKMTSRSVHTSMALSAVLGISFCAVAFLIARPLLLLLGTKPELLEGATLYLSIICLGIPFQTVYNFGAAVQRSAGNSKISLYVLGVSGLVNVLLNLVFVIVLNMSIAGVALATVISHILSAFLVVISLVKRTDSARLVFSKLRIELSLLKPIIKLGLPSGIQSSTFGIANMVLTSAINTLSTSTIYAFTVVNSVDGLASTVMNAYAQAASTFVAQNYGARNYKRIIKSMSYSLIWGVSAGVIGGQLMRIFSEPLAALFVTSSNPLFPEILKEATSMLNITLNFLFLCSLMNTFSGVLKSVGFSLSSMLSCIIGVVGGRLTWIFLFFPMERFNSGAGLIICFPVAWLLTSVLLGMILIIAMRRAKRSFSAEPSIQGEEATA